MKVTNVFLVVAMVLAMGVKAQALTETTYNASDDNIKAKNLSGGCPLKDKNNGTFASIKNVSLSAQMANTTGSVKSGQAVR